MLARQIRKPVLSAIAFFGTLGMLSVGYSAYSGLSTVTAGQPLTTAMWTQVKDNFDAIQARTAPLNASGGNVGIGTANPGYPLDILTTYNRPARYYSSNTDYSMVTLTNSNLTIAQWGQWGIGINGSSPVSLAGFSTGAFVIHQDGYGPRLVIAPNGYVGINVADPQSQFQVGTTPGNGRVRFAGIPSGSTGHYVCRDSNGDLNFGSTCSSSDRNLKTDIETLTGALDRIVSIRGVSFYWNEQEKWRGEGQKIGVIAQELETAYPQVVYKNDKGVRSVDYEALVGPLIEAVKELKSRNDELSERVRVLESKNP